MPRTPKLPTFRLDLAITAESQKQFNAIHKALGFKTKPETFEAIVFSISAKDVLRPDSIARIESKLDHVLEAIDRIA